MTYGTTIGRYEYKYLVSPQLAAAVRAFIQPYCRLDSHGESARDGFYLINSLYFDTDKYALYRAAEDHLPSRIKLRARTYGNSESRTVKLEVKRRVNEMIIKSSASVRTDGWPQLLLAAPMRGGLSRAPDRRDALAAFLVPMKMLNARPKMLVRYERLAFHSTIDNDVRITFDRQVVHQPMTAYNLLGWPSDWAPTCEPGALPASQVIVELKFRRSAPAWLVDLTRKFGFVRRGVSKYRSAIRHSFTAQHHYWDMISPLAAAAWTG